MKPVAVISCPIDVYGGYPSRSRDFVKALFNKKKDEWDIKILPQKWGELSWGYINDHSEEWGWLKDLLIKEMTTQPDYWFQITIPSEFQPVGKWSCGVTAGIETNIADPSWIEGCNRMNLIIVSSVFARDGLKNSMFEKRDSRTQAPIEKIEIKVPIEVLFEGVDTNKFYYKTDQSDSKLNTFISNIPEKFLFLTTGHWMQGTMGEDRKNIALTVKTFLEAFKNSNLDVGLLLKTSIAGSSIMDRDQIIKNINDIKKSIKGDCPNIYLLHGEIKEEEMNELYNHPKVKTMVSLTKGEGYGRPLIEFSQTKKPIAVSGWSGHLDFLQSSGTYLIPGEVKPIHPSAQIDKILIEGSQWFSPNVVEVNRMWKTLLKDYKKYLEPAKIQAFRIKKDFNLGVMGDKLESIINSKAPRHVALELPKLKLPELIKIEESLKQ